MTDHNTTDLQGSIKEQHRQGSLHPADSDMLTDKISGKGYSQNRIDPAGQSSLSEEQTVSSAQRSLSGKGERKKIGGVIVPVAIAFVLGILVTILIFRTVYAPSSDTSTVASAGTEEPVASDEEEAVEETVEKEDAQEQKEETSAEEEAAEEEEVVAPDAIVEIPDPVLKKAIQRALHIGDREITENDALSLTELMYEGSDYELGEEKPYQVKDITGLSAFKNLTNLILYNNQVSDFSALSGLTNLTYLDLGSNQLSDLSALSGLTNLTELCLSDNQLSDISALSDLTELWLNDNQLSDISALSGLTNLSTLWLSNNPVLENKSREEIMEVMSGAENLTNIDF